MRIGIYYPTTLLLIVISGYFTPMQAQEQTQAINLETALELGGANNLTIQEYKLRQGLASADLATARAWWLPDIYGGASLHQLWGNAMNSDGKIFTEVDRQSFWGGLGLNVSWDFGSGIFMANAARLKSKAAAYQSTAAQNKALLEIVQTYYDFLAAQLYYSAYEQLTRQADTISQQITAQVQAGIQFESDALLAKSNYNHLRVEMLNAKTAYNNKSAALTRLLNLDPAIKLLAIDTVMAPIALVSLDDTPASFETAYENRPELKSLALQLRSLKIEKKSSTTGLLLPELRLGTYHASFGDVFSPIDPTSEINALLLWTIPLGSLTYRGPQKQYNARISLQENQIAQVKTRVNEELITAKQQIALAREQLDISLEGSQLSQEALLQSIQRQQLGTVRPFELLQAQEVYLKSRLDYLKSVGAYNKAQYRYSVAMGNNL